MGSSIEWGEAVRLVGVLARDPSSELCAELNDWQAPRSVEWLVLADLFDAFVKANYQRAQKYPRPFHEGRTARRGRTDRPRAEVIELLNRYGHQLDPETEEE